jgi:hypothetical protein
MKHARSGLQADMLYGLTMERIGDLRADAERGRDYRRAVAEPDGFSEPSLTIAQTSSTADVCRREGSLAR